MNVHPYRDTKTFPSRKDEPGVMQSYTCANWMRLTGQHDAAQNLINSLLVETWLVAANLLQHTKRLKNYIITILLNQLTLCYPGKSQRLKALYHYKVREGRRKLLRKRQAKEDRKPAITVLPKIAK